MLEPLARNAHVWTSLRNACLAPLLLIATHAYAQFGSQPVSVTSAAQEVQVTATTAGTVTHVEVLTLGSPNKDFTATGPSTCAASNLAVGITCTLPVAFTPGAPGPRMGAVVLVTTQNGADTVLGVTYISGTGTAESITQIPANPIRANGQIEEAGNLDHGDTAIQALPTDPGSTALDGNGNMYVADTGNNRIRMVCGATATPIIHGTTCTAAGATSTIAGDSTAAYTGDNGPPATAALNHPGSVAVDGAGNLLIADTGNNVIRIVNAVTGTISTVAGNMDGVLCAGVTNSIGDGCPATEAILNRPQRITIDDNGNLIIDDTGNDATRVVTRATGVISTLSVASTTTTIIASLDPSGFGQSITFTVTVSAGSGAENLKGTISLADTCAGATTTLASGLPLNPSGTAAFSISTLAVGQHSIVASYNNTNDPAHKASTSSALIEAVLEDTAVSLTPSANPSTIGQSITFTATVASLGGGVTPAGTLTFYDGSTVLNTFTLNANHSASYTTSALANGLHQIVAVYSGNSSAEVEGSTSPAIDEDVQAPSSISASSSLNPSTYGVPVTFTATVSSSATSPATGSVSFLDNGASIGTGTIAGNPATTTLTISTLSASTHRITTTYTGDSKNQASNSSASPLNQTVTQAQTVTTISAAPASGVAEAPETFTAAVELAQGSAPLTGTVNFTSGAMLLGSTQLNSSGVAAISLTLAAGNYQIVATYQGNANALSSASDVPACSVTSPMFCSGSGPLLYTVALTATQTALTVSPNPVVAASPIVFTATVTGGAAAPTGGVNFLANGVVIGTAPLNGGTATFTDASLAAGSYVLTAEYLGNANDAISTSMKVSETVSPIPTTTSLTTANTTGTDPQVTLTAAVTSNGGNNGSGPAPAGTVTFMNGETPLGNATLDANGIATLAPILVKGANYSIDAVYGGDSYHGSSTSQIISVAGVASGFTVSIAPSSVAISSMQNAAVTVTLTSVSSFTDTIVLSCASLPVTVNCRFASASLNLSAGGTASTQLTIAGNTQSGSAAAMNRGMSRRLLLAGILLPSSLAFGWFFPKRRRSIGRFVATLSIPILAAAALAIIGCGAILQSTASPGNYVIQVTGIGSSTQVVRTQSLNLKIAQ